MSDQSDAFDALAARGGIASAYYDIWGNAHTVSGDARRALLTAMHLPAGDDAAKALRESEEAEWLRILPPVLVARENTALRVTLSLPAGGAQACWRWTLHLEAGEARHGEFTPAHLPHLDNRSIGGNEYVRYALELPPVDSTGYHRLQLDAAPGAAVSMPLIVAPHACYQPDALRDDRRLWGPAVQLYGIRSRRNWGVGDFTDLHALIGIAADAGAAMVGVNPLHAMFPADPGHYSPYSPSSRSFLNTIYLDIEAIPEYAECEPARRLVAGKRFIEQLEALRAVTLVDYAGVATAKRELLDLLYRHFRERHLDPGSARAQEFQRFRADRGAALERLARFDALQEHLGQHDAGLRDWRGWPAHYRDPASPETTAFATAHPDRVDFFAWLQWLADTQLAGAARHARQRGLGIGIYQDIALGANPGGAEVWAGQAVFAAGAYAGAPPDAFAPNGQDWGLPPFAPQRLREAAYAPLIDVLRANMRHAGALRIDHAMWMTRMFWVPAGQSAAHGSYVSYPLDDLLGILALESQRNRCLVIGEALGTVPEGFRERLAAAGILSYRPFLFERWDDGHFKPPRDYPRQSLVTLSTHDLPTLCGLWQNRDIDVRDALQLYPSGAMRDQQIEARHWERQRMLEALAREGLLPAGTSTNPADVPELTAALLAAFHIYLARTPAQVMAVQPEDVLGLAEQANLPGSLDHQHPNWRRRLPLDLEDWQSDERFARLFTALANARSGLP